MRTDLIVPTSSSANELPDTVLWWLGLLVVLSVAWFGLKALARRGVLVGTYERLDPLVQGVRSWVSAAPAVFTYVAVWTATSVVQQGLPKQLADLSATLSSTNIVNLLHEPVRVFFTSGVLVADGAAGFAADIVLFVLIVARLEHRVGSARWIAIAVAAHVLGSILTVRVELIGISHGLLPQNIAVTQDVGVSYVMVGSLGAYLWLVSRRWRGLYLLALSAMILGPLLVSHTIWDLGHFLACAIGTLVGWLVTRWPLRDRLDWRPMVAMRQPRPLPTFDATRARGPLVPTA